MNGKREDAHSTELKSIIMPVMWEQSRGALPFDAMGGIRFRESRWRVTSWPHTWLPAALSLSVRGPPVAALGESPLRCHVCEPPGLHYLLTVHIDLPQRMSPLLCRYGCMGGHPVLWGGEMSLGFAREINSIHSWHVLISIIEVNGKNRLSVWVQVIPNQFSINICDPEAQNQS